jgi:hypothetical protein
VAASAAGLATDQRAVVETDREVVAVAASERAKDTTLGRQLGGGTEQENRATFEREGRATWASKPGREPAARTDSAARRAAHSAE